MAIYLLLFASVPFWHLVFKKQKKVFVTIVALELFAILALKAPTLGVDLDNYSAGYEYIANMSFTEMIASLRWFSLAKLYWMYAYESGYVVVNWICSHIGLSFHGFFVVYAAVSVFVLARFVYKYSKLPWLTFLIFMSLGGYIYFFGIIRQTIAALILLISVDAIKDKKLFRFLVLVFIAFTFHRTALLFLPLYFAANIRFNGKAFKWGFILYGVELLGLLAVGRLLIQTFLKLFDKGYDTQPFTPNKLMLLIFAIAVFLCLTLNFKKNSNDRIYNIACAGFWLGTYLQLTGVYLELLVRSYTGFYLIFFAIILAWAIFDLKKQSKMVYYSMLVMMVTCLFLYYILILNGSEIVPFVPFWS